jgi:hypothetical protein
MLGLPYIVNQCAKLHVAEWQLSQAFIFIFMIFLRASVRNILDILPYVNYFYRNFPIFLVSEIHIGSLIYCEVTFLRIFGKFSPDCVASHPRGL